MLQLSFSVNSGNFLVPALAVLNGNLSFFSAVAATLAGAIAAFIFVSTLSMPGAMYGLPAQYAIRGFLGTRFARFIASPIRVITSLYWFAVQTIGGTIALIEIVKRLTGTKLSFLPISLSLALIMALLALIGFEAVKKASRLFMPVQIIGQLILIYLFVHYAAVHHETGTLFNHQWKVSSFILA
ncbi:cytosine permease [Neobacillus terrae]|uniref:cytosine permease n=1 Tax=Neobacillus terrae TaxID=3034837 RepID=UPI00308301F0